MRRYVGGDDGRKRQPRGFRMRSALDKNLAGCDRNVRGLSATDKSLMGANSREREARHGVRRGPMMATVAALISQGWPSISSSPLLPPSQFGIRSFSRYIAALSWESCLLRGRRAVSSPRGSPTTPQNTRPCAHRASSRPFAKSPPSFDPSSPGDLYAFLWSASDCLANAEVRVRSPGTTLSH